MRNLSGVIMLSCLSSCGIFKQSSKITEQNLEKVNVLDKKEVYAVIDKQKNEALLLSRTAVADADYSIRIWPKGLFYFSPSGQISAEADSVLISGKQRWRGEQLEMQQINQRENLGLKEVVLSKESHESNKIRVEKIKKPLTKFAFVALGIVFLVVFMAVRKFILVVRD